MLKARSYKYLFVLSGAGLLKVILKQHQNMTTNPFNNTLLIAALRQQLNTKAIK